MEYCNLICNKAHVCDYEVVTLCYHPPFKNLLVVNGGMLSRQCGVGWDVDLSCIGARVGTTHAHTVLLR